MSVPLARISRRRVDGVLLLDKPPGLSSNAALQRAKRAFGAEKAGHTGTLDPLATGLLPICFGDATKFAQVLLDSRKAYIATVRFGTATTTGDAEGAVVAEGPATFTRGDLARVLPQFLGTVEQVPPRHAALKLHGRKYYDYARAGVEIARAPRSVEIDAIEILDCAPSVATLRVACGKGTYIRVLAEDVGKAMGTCAHLQALRRTASGPFALEQAVKLEVLEAMTPSERTALLMPAHAPIAEMRRLQVDATTADDLSHGRIAAVPKGTEDGPYCCFDPGGRLLGIVEVASGWMRAVRLVRAG